MRILLLSCLIGIFGSVALANVIPSTELKTLQSRGLNEDLRDALENVKKQMPCGINGIIMAPFQKEYIEIHLKKSIIEFIGSIIDLRLDGLNFFDVFDIKVSALTLKANIDINFNELRARSEYVANTFLLHILKLTGRGNLDITLRDLRIIAAVQLGANDDGLFLKNCELSILLGGIRSDCTGLVWGSWGNKLANKAIEQLVPIVIKHKQEQISQIAQEIVTEKVNEALKGITIQDILDMISANSEPSQCEPPSPFVQFL